MSLQLRTAFEIPPKTRRVALAAFPHGTLCLQLAQSLGALYADERLGRSLPAGRTTGGGTGTVGLVTVLRFIENLSDHSAADAVRSRRIGNGHLPKADEARQALAATIGAATGSFS